jgi:branched-chain amino acid transport system permease protein
VRAALRVMRIVLPLAVVLLVGSAPFLVSDTYTLKLLTYAGVNVLVVVGLALLFGYAGQVSLGHAAFVGIGAYTCAYAGLELKAPWLVAFLAAGIVSALGGLLLALPSLKLKGHYLAMATLGFGELASLAFKEAVPVTGGVNGLSGIPSPSIGPWELTSVASNYWMVWGVVGIAALVAANLTALRPGRAMRSIHGSELGAAASGVDVTGIKVRVFVVSAAMAGLAGALYASTVGFISPSLFTLQASVGYLAMAVIGGTGSLAGPMAAAAALTLVQYVDSLVPGLPRSTHELVQAYVPDVYGLAIVLVVLFAPGGLGSLWRRRATREETS